MTLKSESYLPTCIYFQYPDSVSVKSRVYNLQTSRAYINYPNRNIKLNRLRDFFKRNLTQDNLKATMEQLYGCNKLQRLASARVSPPPSSGQQQNYKHGGDHQDVV